MRHSAWFLAPVIGIVAGLSSTRGDTVETDDPWNPWWLGSSHKRRSPCRPQRHSWRLRLAQQATRDQASSPRRCPLPSPCHLRVFWRRHWSGGQSKPPRSTSRRRRVVRRQLPPRPSTSDGPWPAALRAEGANIWPVVLRAREPRPCEK